jgi:hypothetical protein
MHGAAIILIITPVDRFTRATMVRAGEAMAVTTDGTGCTAATVANETYRPRLFSPIKHSQKLLSTQAGFPGIGIPLTFELEG